MPAVRWLFPRLRSLFLQQKGPAPFAPMPRLTLTHSLLLSISIASIAGTAEPARYVARLADGSYLHGNKLTHWHERVAQPQLDGRSLFDSARPLRWLRDRQLAPGPAPRAAVELVTGDLLPGFVQGYVVPQEPWSPAPAHFLVEPSTQLEPPETPQRSTIRVVASHVKRIVWERSSTLLTTPNSLRLRDGSTFTYRALRWGSGHVQVLLTSGSRKFEFTELAEIYLAHTDFWTLWKRELAALVPTGKSRLYHLTTTDGLALTASLERLAMHNRGSAEEPHTWIHGLQPAWSLDLLWVPLANVWLWQSFAPHEVPLERVPFEVVEQKATLLPVAPPLTVNRNIRGEWLRSGTQEIGHGCGTGTSGRFRFALPPEATEFTGAVGLDRLAGSGGCARVQVQLAGSSDPKVSGQKLWESPLLQGSTHTHPFQITLPAAEGSRALELATDAAHNDRPPGADPFEIRDFVNWLDPLVTCAPESWQQAVAAEFDAWHPAGPAWHVTAPPGSSVQRVPVLDGRAPWPKSFLSALAVQGECQWSAELPLKPENRWLLVYVHRLTDHENDPLVEVRAGGELLGSAKVSKRSDSVAHERPLVFPIGDFASAQAKLAVTIYVRHAHAASPLLLRAAFTTATLPFARRIFAEAELPISAPGTPAPEFISSDHHSGLRALKLPVGSAATFRFDPPVVIRGYPGAGEYRHLRIALKKRGGGIVVARWSGSFENGTAEHVAGRGAVAKQQHRLHNDPFKDDWVSVTADLHNDLGDVTLNELTLLVPDGEFALLDDLAFGFGWDDFHRLAQEKQHFPQQQVLAQERLAPHRERLLASVVRIEFEAGSGGAGVLLHSNQEVLTTGSVIGEPGRKCTVITADGTRHAAVTRGLFRTLDLGLVRLEQPAANHGLGRNDWSQPDPTEFLLAAIPVEGKWFSTQVASPWRYVAPELWSDLPASHFVPGLPLLDHAGHVLALARRRSPNGHVIYSKLEKWPEIENRLRNGETWGEWPEAKGE